MNKQEEAAIRKEYADRVASFEPCPKSVRSRTGIKVVWYYYATLEEAQIASQWAMASADRAWQFGYDFGYCSPGSISKQEDGTYEVCFP